jgi:hypothetical protein
MEEQLPISSFSPSSHQVAEEKAPRFHPLRLLFLGMLFILVLSALSISSYLLAIHSKTTPPSELATQPSPTPQSTSINTWLLYTTSQFSFRYPKNWTVHPIKNGVTTDIQILPPGGMPTPDKGGFIVIHATQSDQTLQEFMQSTNPATGSLYAKEYTDQTPLDIDNQDALEAYGGCCGGLGQTAFVKYHTQLYSMTLFGPKQSDGLIINHDIFTQFLETFIFGQDNSPSSPPTFTPTPEHTYKDSYFGYSIKYPVSWIFRRTYDPDIQKQAPTDIKSGFDLTFNETVNNQPMTQAVIVINVLDRHNAPDTQTWISQYDLNYPKAATKQTITFNNTEAIKYSNFTQSDHPTEYIYFLSGNYAYRIEYWEAAGISDTTRQIVNSLLP